MLRAERVTGSGRLRLLVAAMPEGEDPADMLLTPEGGDRLRAALADAVDLAVFHARAILADADLGTPAGRDKALDEVAPVLAAMRESITKQELVREVTDRLDAPAELVAQRMKGGLRAVPPPAQPVGADAEAAPAAPPRRRKATPQEEREFRMLALCLASPERGADALARLREDHFSSPFLRRCFLWLREHLDDPLAGLDDDDANLHNAIQRLQAMEHEEPTPQNFEFREMLLERDRIDRELRDGGGADAARQVELQRERARLQDAIHARSF
jgi:DNA primase